MVTQDLEFDRAPSLRMIVPCNPCPKALYLAIQTKPKPAPRTGTHASLKRPAGNLRRLLVCRAMDLGCSLSLPQRGKVGGIKPNGRGGEPESHEPSRPDPFRSREHSRYALSPEPG